MRRAHLSGIVVASAAALVLTACGGGSDSEGAGDDAGAEGASSDAFPVTIEHTYGETVIEEEPQRVATVSYGNYDSVLALGVTPVAMTRSDYADPDGDGMAPWTVDKIEELGGEAPALLDETDGIDFEALADTAPDVILAPYSGLSEEDYETLSEIAPTVAYSGTAWGTSWEDQLTVTGQALGLEDEAAELVQQGQDRLAELTAGNPAIADKRFLLSYFDATDLSNVNFYTTGDSRVGYMEELGLQSAEAVVAADPQEFWVQQSSEQIENYSDVQLIVIYGNDETLSTLQGDPLLNRIPAVASGAVAVIDEESTVAAALTPTPLSVNAPETEELVDQVGTAAGSVE